MSSLLFSPTHLSKPPALGFVTGHLGQGLFQTVSLISDVCPSPLLGGGSLQNRHLSFIYRDAAASTEPGLHQAPNWYF